jgi:hypothetical protein
LGVEGLIYVKKRKQRPVVVVSSPFWAECRIHKPSTTPKSYFPKNILLVWAVYREISPKSDGFEQKFVCIKPHQIITKRMV